LGRSQGVEGHFLSEDTESQPSGGFFFVRRHPRQVALAENGREIIQETEENSAAGGTAVTGRWLRIAKYYLVIYRSPVASIFYIFDVGIRHVRDRHSQELTAD
jgi:hypothetical protein